MTDKEANPAHDTAAPERPAHCRSPLWDHHLRIREMLAARYSYQQISNALQRRGVQLSASEVGKWCRRQGLRSAVSSRHRGRPGADKKSAPPSTAAASVSPPSPPASAPPPRSVLAEALGPEPGDEWAAFRKPETEDRKS